MLFLEKISAKILSRKAAAEKMEAMRRTSEPVFVFTNGCFDLLHFGHLHYLSAAWDLGTHLIIGLNSRESVSRLKGPNRPIHDEISRVHLIAGLECVDMVVVFDEDTPENLIHALKPDILVKGGDYSLDTIVGADFVLSYGGKVQVLPFVDGYSTSLIEARMKG